MVRVGKDRRLDSNFSPFCRYRTFVSEDAGPNTLVATVLAKDPDGDGIIYSITAGNEEGNFVIDNQKGDTSSFSGRASYIAALTLILTLPVKSHIHFPLIISCYRGVQ